MARNIVERVVEAGRGSAPLIPLLNYWKRETEPSRSDGTTTWIILMEVKY
jgi:hypothetical protein